MGVEGVEAAFPVLWMGGEWMWIRRRRGYGGHLHGIRLRLNKKKQEKSEIVVQRVKTEGKKENNKLRRAQIKKS